MWAKGRKGGEMMTQWMCGGSRTGAWLATLTVAAGMLLAAPPARSGEVDTGRSSGFLGAFREIMRGKRIAAQAAGAEKKEDDPAAGGDEKSWSVEVDSTFNSKYIWRGIEVVDEPVWQPSITFSWEGLSLNVWGNMDLTDANDDAGTFTEIDYTLSYEGQWKLMAYGFGVVHYQFPTIGSADTTEVFVSVGLDVPLSPTVTLYQDVDEADGLYVNASVGHTFEDVFHLSETIAMSIDLAASLGWGSSKHNDFYYGSDDSGLADAVISAGFPVDLGRGWTLTPSVNYSWLLDNGIRDAMDDDDNFWSAISLRLSF